MKENKLKHTPINPLFQEDTSETMENINKEPTTIGQIEGNTKDFANKYLDDANYLKKGIGKQLNHNPLIQRHIVDTLCDVENIMSFISSFVIADGSNETRRLEQSEQTAIFLLSQSAIGAIKFEQERASYLLSQSNQHKEKL